MTTFSIVTPVYNPPIDVLQDTIDSVTGQSWQDWEWILVDDCSPDPAVREALRAAAQADQRLVVVERETNGHIVAASNDGLAMATGDFIVLLDHDDLLTPDALEAVADVLADDVDYVYSDEDKVNAAGDFYDTFAKPDWSPERLLGQMYTSHLSVMRRSVVDEVGGFRHGVDGSQDHDLALRVSERARKVVHIPQVLYHWRAIEGSAAAAADAKPYAQIAGLKVVSEAIERQGIAGRVEPIPPYPGHYRIVRDLDPATRIAIIVPTRGQSGEIGGSDRVFVVEAIRHALAHTEHHNLTVVVVYDTVTPPAVLDALTALDPRITAVPYDKPFNFSEKINVGAVHADADVIVLLNDDTEAISDGWLEQLVAPLAQPDIGMTGAKLLYEDGTIQHAGLVYDHGQYYHPYSGSPENSPGRLGDLIINREASGVTGAACAVRTGVFDEVGGLSEQLPINFNDIDFGNKILRAGYRIVWVAGSVLSHFESKSRPRVVAGVEVDTLRSRWGFPIRDAYLPG